MTILASSQGAASSGPRPVGELLFIGGWEGSGVAPYKKRRYAHGVSPLWPDRYPPWSRPRPGGRRPRDAEAVSGGRDQVLHQEQGGGAAVHGQERRGDAAAVRSLERRFFFDLQPSSPNLTPNPQSKPSSLIDIFSNHSLLLNNSRRSLPSPFPHPHSSHSTSIYSQGELMHVRRLRVG